jgi:hypothetical protein
LQNYDLECVNGETLVQTSTIFVDMKEQDLHIVRHPHPPQPKYVEGLTLAIKLRRKGMMDHSAFQCLNNFAWRMLVYGALVEPNNVILFIKD